MTYSAHMVQHVLLAQLIPLPVVLAVRRFGLRRAYAPCAWIIGLVIMIGTSVPPAYQVAQTSATVDWAIRGVLVIAGLIFWLPVCGRAEQMRLRPGVALLYLVTACFATTLAGAYIAFSATSTDQAVAGLIMWVPCCIVYLSAALTVVILALRGESPAARLSVSLEDAN